MPGIRAEGTAAPRKVVARCGDRIRRRAFFHPIYNGGEHIEFVERRRTAAAMAHARYKEDAAPVFHQIEAAIGAGHVLVIAERIERRKPRIAQPVVKDQFSAVLGKGGK